MYYFKREVMAEAVSNDKTAECKERRSCWLRDGKVGA
jgi:hypothetical protein